jgi:hypothetical protein
MWLLNKLKQINEAEMQKLGFKLTAEDIYDINKSSMKDGIVRLGGWLLQRRDGERRRSVPHQPPLRLRCCAGL